VVGRFALRPLAQIAAACQRIAAGDLEQEVDLRRRDEFGLVAQAVNRMTTELKRQIYTVRSEREQLNEALSENRRLETVRQTFVANVSHELKTPLAAITSMVETLIEAEDIEPKERAHFYARVHAQAERLNRLVMDLLALSRLESARGEIEFQPVDLAGLVERAAQAFLPLAKRKGLTLGFRLPDAPLIVVGEGEGLRVMMNNLLQNAVHYTPPGGEVDVTLKLEGEDGAVLTVRDTGIGIAPEHQARVFERFYRVDRARSRNSGGTGLGLSIVKHVAIADLFSVYVSLIRRRKTNTAIRRRRSAPLRGGLLPAFTTVIPSIHEIHASSGPHGLRSSGFRNPSRSARADRVRSRRFRRDRHAHLRPRLVRGVCRQQRRLPRALQRRRHAL
jgi:signal transduction histidine kinase